MIGHIPPCEPSPYYRPGVVIVDMYEPGSVGMWHLMFKDVTCWHRPIQSGAGELPFQPVLMKSLRSNSNGITYATTLPGVEEGTTEYYITWFDQSDKTRRSPSAGTFRCPGK